jgi:Tol biopolymer transport system component
LTTGAAQYSVSETGSLVYAPGSFEPVLENAVVWVDRQGKATPVEMRPMSHGMVRISPDGKSASVTEYYVDRIVWVFDLLRGTLERQTFDSQSSDGIWSPDGQSLVFRSNNSGPTRLYLKSLSSSDPVPLTPGPLDYPGSFTTDGKEVIYTSGQPGISSSTYDIYVVRLDEPNKPRPLVNSKFTDSFPSISPDGKWLTYCSDESGRFEVYVQPYPGPGKRVTVSTAGGTAPAWSRNGNELFFLNGPAMMAVRFSASGKEFTPEKPIQLFQGPFLFTLPARMYDVGPDGRFLMIYPIPSQNNDRNAKIFPSSLRIVLNWTSELNTTSQQQGR